jgi:predicted permease
LALPLLNESRVDTRALGWTLLIAVGAAVLFGLAPGLRFSRIDLQNSLKDGGHGASTGRQHDRMRAVLVISEVALACVLLVGAGLLLRSFLRVLDIDLGFQPDHAASIKVDYDDSAPTDDAQAAKLKQIFEQVIARVSALPGVESAGIVDYLPLGPNRSWGALLPKGKTYPKDVVFPSPLVYVCTPGYVRAMGMRLRGRDFTWEDELKGQQVVMINAAAAHFYWPGEDAVGKVLMAGKTELHVVGVLDDVHASGVEEERGWQIYYPATQQNPSDAELVIRSSVPSNALAGSVLRALRELNPNQPAAEFTPIDALVDHADSPRKFFVLLVSIFAEFGLVLATLGIYGVISYSVTQRTQEIGIRMALGATQGRVLRGVLGKTMQLAVAGIALGTVASFVVAKWIAALLFGTKPTDPVTFAAMVVIMTAVAFIAGYIPAWRASRVDPMVALRAN